MKCKDCHYFNNKKCKVLDFIGFDTVINHKGDKEKVPNANYFEITKSEPFYYSEKSKKDSIWRTETFCDLNENEDCKYFIDKNIYCNECEYYKRYSGYEKRCSLLDDIGWDSEKDHKGIVVKVKNEKYHEVIRKTLSETSVENCVLNENKDCEYFKSKKLKTSNVKNKEKIMRCPNCGYTGEDIDCIWIDDVRNEYHCDSCNCNFSFSKEGLTISKQQVKTIKQKIFEEFGEF